MKFNLLKVTAEINFILLFPFYIIGQMLIQMGYLSPSPLFSFSLILTIALPIAITGLLRTNALLEILNLASTKAFLVFLFFYALFVIAKHLAETNQDFLEYHLKSIFRLIAFYAITLNFHLVGVFNSRSNALALFSIGLLIVFLSALGIMNISAIESGDGYIELDYQMIAFLILFSIINHISANKWHKKLPTLIIAIGALYYLGARTEFYISIALLTWGLLWHQKNKITAITGLIIIAIPLALIGHATLDSAELSKIRIFSVLFEGADVSQTSRATLTMNAVETILKHPLLGDYASHDLGSYSHNLLSAWVDFGFIGFLYLFAIVSIPTFNSYLNAPKAKSTAHMLATTSLTALIIALVIAKTYNYSMLSVALAYYGLWQLSNRKQLRYD